MIDIFIPCTPRHYKTLPSAIWSAMTQTYTDIRIVLYMDGVNSNTNVLLEKWVPTLEINLPPFYIEINDAGPSGNAGKARDWYFNFKDKADYVKFLDADDNLTPKTIEIMMSYVADDIDAVFCPLQLISSNRYYLKIIGKPYKNQSGSGSMLLSKKMINQIVNEGFSWETVRGDDEKFLDHIKDRFNILSTKEDFLYIYYK